MQRRAFLGTLAAVPALTDGGIASGHTAMAQPRPGLKLGAVTYNIAKDWDIPTIIRNLSAAEFEAVELRTTHRHGVEIGLSAAARADVRRQFEASPVKIGGLGTTCEFQSPDAATVRKNIDETKAWIQLAHDVGSPGVKVRPNGVPRTVPEERTLEQIGRSLAECAAFARDHGVVVHLEVHGEDSARLPRIRRIFDHAGNPPGLKVCWNSNQTDLDDGGFAPAFDLVKAQIGQVHMRDLYLDEYPWRTLLTSLVRLDFQGYCFAEIPESSDPIRVLHYFRALFRAYQA